MIGHESDPLDVCSSPGATLPASASVFNIHQGEVLGTLLGLVRRSPANNQCRVQCCGRNDVSTPPKAGSNPLFQKHRHPNTRFRRGTHESKGNLNQRSTHCPSHDPLFIHSKNLAQLIRPPQDRKLPVSSSPESSRDLQVHTKPPHLLGQRPGV